MYLCARLLPLCGRRDTLLGYCGRAHSGNGRAHGGRPLFALAFPVPLVAYASSDAFPATTSAFLRNPRRTRLR